MGADARAKGLRARRSQTRTSTYLIPLFIYLACDDVAAAVSVASVVVSVVVDIVCHILFR